MTSQQSSQLVQDRNSKKAILVSMEHSFLSHSPKAVNLHPTHSPSILILLYLIFVLPILLKVLIEADWQIHAHCFLSWNLIFCLYMPCLWVDILTIWRRDSAPKANGFCYQINLLDFNLVLLKLWLCLPQSNAGISTSCQPVPESTAWPYPSPPGAILTFVPLEGPPWQVDSPGQTCWETCWHDVTSVR